MRRDLPADDQVTMVMEHVLAQAAENGRRASVTDLLDGRLVPDGGLLKPITFRD